MKYCDLKLNFVKNANRNATFQKPRKMRKIMLADLGNGYLQFLAIFLCHIHTCTSSASGKLSLHFVHFALSDFSEILVAFTFKRHFAESQSCAGRSCPYEFRFSPRRSCLMRSDHRQVRHVFVISGRSSQRFSGSEGALSVAFQLVCPSSLRTFRQSQDWQPLNKPSA